MRLIDADTLNYVRVRIYHDDGTIGGYNAVVPSSEIKNAPTVDAVPARHGRWLNKRYGVAFDGKRFPFRTIGTCSECHETSCDAGDYCPWCGAKMDAERKEE